MTLPTKEGFKEIYELKQKKAKEYPERKNLYAVIPIDKENDNCIEFT